MINESFAHRPKIGLSVGILVFYCGDVHCSVAMRHPKDHDNRVTARSLIRSRFHEDDAYVGTLGEGALASPLMIEFRKLLDVEIALGHFDTRRRASQADLVRRVMLRAITSLNLDRMRVIQ